MTFDNQIKERKMNPRQEALKIIKEFGLKEVPISFMFDKKAVLRDCSEKDGDSKSTLEVPPDVFYTLVERYNPSHAVEYAIPGDNSGEWKHDEELQRPKRSLQHAGRRQSRSVPGGKTTRNKN